LWWLGSSVDGADQEAIVLPFWKRKSGLFFTLIQTIQEVDIDTTKY
jgi:hypothetical protein